MWATETDNVLMDIEKGEARTEEIRKILLGEA